MSYRKVQRRTFLSRLAGSAALQIAALLAIASAAPVQAQVDPVSAQPPIQYDSQGKRDPFISLQKPKTSDDEAALLSTPPLNRRPPGLAGLLIDEVTVVGVVTAGDSPLLLLQGVDNFTYFASARDQLFDGYVESIQGEEVVFMRSVRDTRGRTHRWRVFKKLYTQEVRVEEENQVEDEKKEGNHEDS
ncbi:MAG: pilus assembly protein PilP [Acidobacteriota bacterium]